MGSPKGSALRDVLTQGLLILLLGLLWWANAPLIVGWEPRVVLTGSMRPALRPGDVILTAPVVRPRELPAGRVVVVRRPDLAGGSYVHRVVRHDAAGNLVTRGDANPGEDYPAVVPDQVMGEVRLVVPLIGLVPACLRTGRLLPAGLGLLVLLLVVVTAFRLDPAARGFTGVVRSRPGTPSGS